MVFKNTNNRVPVDIDHLVYTATNLESGIDKVEDLLGIRPVLGGRHPAYGTHNAMLSLGKSTYLEIIAPDPDLPPPKRGRLFRDKYFRGTKLTTWVLRSKEIDDLVSQATSNGLGLGPVQSGSREKPDGTMLFWKLSDPYAMPFDGAVPFIISWGDTPHPAESVSRAGELTGFRIEHPDPDALSNSLELIGLDIDVKRSIDTRLIATIKCRNGLVELS